MNMLEAQYFPVPCSILYFNCNDFSNLDINQINFNVRNILRSMTGVSYQIPQLGILSDF